MPQPLPPYDDGGFQPLSVAEQARLRLLLDNVSTETLLHSLLDLKRDSQDGSLIIAALLDRIPPYRDDRPPMLTDP